MQAMELQRPGERLTLVERPDPQPSHGEVRVRVSACGVCRTDLHVVDGELSHPKLPIVPGHEIVGRVDLLGTGVERLSTGMRVGIPWLGWTCGRCRYCREGRENSMRFTAVHRLYAGRWLRNACCCRCSFCFSPAGGGRRCRHGAPPVRRLDRLALAPHGGRWQTTRPLRVRRCRAYHCPGRPLAGPRGVPLYAVWRQGWSGLCAQARRVLGGFVRGRPARGAGLRDHLCARRDIGADGTQGRSKRAAALSARAST